MKLTKWDFKSRQARLCKSQVCVMALIHLHFGKKSSFFWSRNNIDFYFKAARIRHFEY